MNRITELERKYVNQVLDNEFNTSKNSIFNNRMEELFKEKFNSKYAIGLVNGTATMHTALKALDIGNGDEVIVPPLTMSSPAIAVMQSGAVPVFADVDRNTFCISPDGIRNVITSKTKAIITVSLYGLSPDYDEILKICNENGIYLIEDNAECFLGEYKGKLVGEFGDFSSFSFQASKHITAGEGGMLTTNSEDLAVKARRFTSLGYAGIGSSKRKISKEDIQNPTYDRHVSLGYNYRMSELGAAVMVGQLERIEELVNIRVEVAKKFDEVIKSTTLFTRQEEPTGYKNSYWAYSVTMNTENPEEDWFKFREIWNSLGGDGYYSAWKLSYEEPYFKNDVQLLGEVWQKFEKGLCPNAEYLQPRMLQFKTNYWDLNEATIQAEILSKAIEKYQEISK